MWRVTLDSTVKDICWSPLIPDAFGVVTNKQVQVFSVGEASRRPVFEYSNEPIPNVIDFGKHEDACLIGGCKISYLDLRNLKAHQISSYQIDWKPNDVTAAKFHHKYRGVFTTGHEDGSVLIWDFINPTEEDESSCKVSKNWRFIHKGHIYKVNDLDWRTSEEYTIASVDDAAKLQVWRPNSDCFANITTK